MSDVQTTPSTDIKLIGDAASETIARVNACKEGINNAVTALSKYPVVASEEERIIVNGYINRAKKNVKQVQDIRLAFTRKIDEYKGKFMEAEKKLLSPLNKAIAEAQEACNQFVRLENQRIQAEKARIQQEKQASLASTPHVTEDAVIQAEFTAQIKEQSLGTISNVQQTWKAQKDPGARWDDIIVYYIQNGGDQSKFDFLLDFLLKAGRPQIEGVEYIPDVRNVAR